MTRPLCGVLMPFGVRAMANGQRVDFDQVYAELAAPAIAAAGMQAWRAGATNHGGVTAKTLHEHLALCEYALIDVSCADAGAHYLLGVRDAARARASVVMYVAGEGVPDCGPTTAPALAYTLNPAGTPAQLEQSRAALGARLEAARADTPYRPLYQLVEEFPGLQRLKTDVFRDQVDYSEAIKARLASARGQGVAALHAAAAGCGPVAAADPGVVIDLLLSFRAVRAWDDMLVLIEAMAAPLARSVMVREQKALALNRAGRGDEAEGELRALIATRGASSETCSILGRVYKDRWEVAQQAGDSARADALLEQAIAAYLAGFEADWRDAFPGINAVTLMTLRMPADPRANALLPVVRYAVERRIAEGRPDYWDYASLIELAVLASDAAQLTAAASAALARIREGWEAESTARNLRLIREARAARGERFAAADDIEAALRAKARPFG